MSTAPIAVPVRSVGRRSWARTTAASPVSLVATCLLLAVMVLAVVAPIIWGSQARQIDTDSILQGSTAEHWAGTDRLGRDVLFRVLVATRMSVGLALLATVIGVTVGITLGAAPAVTGRRVGRIVTTSVNVAVAFPGLLLALFFAVVFGVGAKGAVLAIGFAMAPGFARLTQTLVATVAGLDYVSAARLLGIGRFRLLVRHILPNVAEPLVINATVGAGGALLAFSGLSFLGLGVQAPSYDWGRLLSEGLQNIYLHPMSAMAPAAALVIAGLAFNMFGEAVAKGVGSRSTQQARRGRSPHRSSGPTVTRDDCAVSTGREVLVVENLTVTYPGTDEPIEVVRGVSFSVARGEILGVVGESGSGKSQTALAVAQLIEAPGVVSADRLSFMGEDILEPAPKDRQADRARRKLLGTSMAMVFQDPATSLNPTMRIGRQLAEGVERHQGLTRKQALDRATDRIRAVRISAPERRVKQYPHEFSGGMRQRAMIGMGIMQSPALIVADEPTTALDVTVQRQVLRLLTSISTADDVAILLISHDISVIADMCDRVLVMYAGRVVEDIASVDLRTRASHPYTRALIQAVADMDTDLDQPLAVIAGRPALAGQVPSGCAFAPRCPLATEMCREEDPSLTVRPGGSRVACWHVPGQGRPVGLEDEATNLRRDGGTHE